MELPQKRSHKPLRIILALMIALASVTTASATSTTKAAESSIEVATTQSYTYFADVPEWGQDSVAKCINNGFIVGTGSDSVIRLDLSQDFLRTIVLLDRAGFLGEDNSGVSDTWFAPEPTISEETIETSQEDRTSPIYEVYKNGQRVTDATAEIQWTIRDLLIQYNYAELEKIVFGMAVVESTFNPNSSNGGCYGLYQIQNFWINGANITHFTDDYRSRNLHDPYDATLTLIEMWEYAINAYSIDISTDQGVKDLLYWHNTGKYVKNINWNYSNLVFGYADELVALQ